MKRGDTFLHQHWIAGDRTPLRCIVTSVREGWVYWKQEGERKAKKMRFELAKADKYVMQDNSVKKEGA